MRRLLPAIVLALALIAPALAQNSSPPAPPQPSHPDLSGTWKLNGAASRIPADVLFVSETIHIECMGSTIRIKTTVDTTDQLETFVTDGNEHVVRVFGDQPLVHNVVALIHIAYWEKRTLVTVSISSLANPVAGGPEIPGARSTERWSLSKDGRQLYRDADLPKHTWVYDKQTPLSSQ